MAVFNVNFNPIGADKVTNAFNLIQKRAAAAAAAVDPLSKGFISVSKSAAGLAVNFANNNKLVSQLLGNVQKFTPQIQNIAKLGAAWTIANSGLTQYLKALGLLSTQADVIAKGASLARFGAAQSAVAGISPQLGAAIADKGYFASIDLLQKKASLLGQTFQKISTEQFKATLLLLANWRQITAQIQASYAALQVNLIGYERIDINLARIKDKLDLSETALNNFRDTLSQIGRETGTLRGELSQLADILIVEENLGLDEAVKGLDAIAKAFQRSGLREQGQTLEQFGQSFVEISDAFGDQNLAKVVDQVDTLQKAVGNSLQDITQSARLLGREIVGTTKTTTEELLTLIGVLQSQGLEPRQAGSELARSILQAQQVASKALSSTGGALTFDTGAGQIQESLGDIRSIANSVSLSLVDANGNFDGILDALPKLREQLNNIDPEKRGAVVRALFGTNVSTIETLLSVSQDEIDNLFSQIKAQSGDVTVPGAITDSYAQALAEFNAAVDDITAKISEALEPIEKFFLRISTRALRITDALPAPVEKLFLLLRGFAPVLQTIGTLLTPLFQQWVLWKVAAPLLAKYIGQLDKGVVAFKELADQQKNLEGTAKKASAIQQKLTERETQQRQKLLELNKKIQTESAKGGDRGRLNALDQERKKLESTLDATQQRQAKVNSLLENQKEIYKQTASQIASDNGLNGQQARLSKFVGTNIAKVESLGNAYVKVSGKVRGIGDSIRNFNKVIDTPAQAGTGVSKAFDRIRSQAQAVSTVVKETSVAAFRSVSAISQGIVSKIAPSVKAIAADLLPLLVIGTVISSTAEAFNNLTKASKEINRAISDAKKEAAELSALLKLEELNSGKKGAEELNKEIRQIRIENIRDDFGFVNKQVNDLISNTGIWTNKLDEATKLKLAEKGFLGGLGIRIKDAIGDTLTLKNTAEAVAEPFRLLNGIFGEGKGLAERQLEGQEKALSDYTDFAKQRLSEVQLLFQQGLDPDSTAGKKAQESIDRISEKLFEFSALADGEFKDSALGVANDIIQFTSELDVASDGATDTADAVSRLKDVLDNLGESFEDIEIIGLEAEKKAYQNFGNNAEALEQELTRIQEQERQNRLAALKLALQQAQDAEVEAGQNKADEIEKIQKQILELEIQGEQDRIKNQEKAAQESERIEKEKSDELERIEKDRLETQEALQDAALQKDLRNIDIVKKAAELAANERIEAQRKIIEGLDDESDALRNQIELVNLRGERQNILQDSRLNQLDNELRSLQDAQGLLERLNDSETDINEKRAIREQLQRQGLDLNVTEAQLSEAVRQKEAERRDQELSALIAKQEQERIALQLSQEQERVDLRRQVAQAEIARIEAEALIVQIKLALKAQERLLAFKQMELAAKRREGATQSELIALQAEVDAAKTNLEISRTELPLAQRALEISNEQLQDAIDTREESEAIFAAQRENQQLQQAADLGVAKADIIRAAEADQFARTAENITQRDIERARQISRTAPAPAPSQFRSISAPGNVVSLTPATPQLLSTPDFPSAIVPQAIPLDISPVKPELNRIEFLLTELVNAPRMGSVNSTANFYNQPNPLQTQIEFLQGQMRAARGAL